MSLKYLKRVVPGLVIISLFFGLLIIFNEIKVNFVDAQSNEVCKETDVQGWAWSDNVGWISFSCLNEHEVGEGVHYGVDIDEETGVFSGHAWSDNAGWISFDEEDLEDCPEEPCQAYLEDEEQIQGNLHGWAKVLDSEEWISLSGDIHEDGEKIGEYGVEIIEEEFHGWAWGDDSLGWISFNCENMDECDESDYRVWSSLIKTTIPAVRTDPATDINAEEGTATLNGTLFSLGGDDETDVWFEWGTEFDELTETTEPETKTEIASFSEEIPVELEEEYYYRAVAENEEGQTTSDIMKFEVTHVEGDLIIRHNEEERGIEITEEGRIEITE